MTSLSRLARDWTPPALVRLGGRLAGRSSTYALASKSWAEAVRSGSRYDDRAILERVVHATREVVAGRAKAERDSVLFDHLPLPYQLLAPLLRCGLANGGVLDVLDFGGSLGSTYRQCRSFLSPLRIVKWHVIEQPAFVAAGRSEFETDELCFHLSLDELPAPQAPRIVLTSSVLQYLERPWDAVAAFDRSGASTWVIDRTPFSSLDQDLLCVQTVPRHIYAASYPLWLFSRLRFERHIADAWCILDRFTCPEGVQVARGVGRFEFEGVVLERRS